MKSWLQKHLTMRHSGWWAGLPCLCDHSVPFSLSHSLCVEYAPLNVFNAGWINRNLISVLKFGHEQLKFHQIWLKYTLHYYCSEWMLTWQFQSPGYSSYVAEFCYFNTLKPRQNGRNFADVIFKCIFLNENVWILIEISLKFVPKCPVNNIPALVQIMAWCRPGDKPLSEPMMVRLLTHICITWPQWVKARSGTKHCWIICAKKIEFNG